MLSKDESHCTKFGIGENSINPLRNEKLRKFWEKLASNSVVLSGDLVIDGATNVNSHAHVMMWLGDPGFSGSKSRPQLFKGWITLSIG